MKRTAFLLPLLLLLVFTGGGASAQDLREPFFPAGDQPCVLYSQASSAGMPGFVRSYYEPAAGEQGQTCYWDASVIFYGLEAPPSIKPDWCPTDDCVGVGTETWPIEENVFPGGNEAFWVVYPLPAGRVTIQVGDLSWQTVLAQGTNVYRLR